MRLTSVKLDLAGPKFEFLREVEAGQMENYPGAVRSKDISYGN